MPSRSIRARPLVRAGALAAIVAGAILGSGCTAAYPRRDPVGEVFPSVAGEALDGTKYEVPEDFSGDRVLLIVGYEMDSQFDIDRWLLALHNGAVDVDVYELPTVRGMVPGMFAGRIDEGMRSGIPEEDWASVITIYDDAQKVARFLGSENATPARVVLVDASGRVAYFHDRGFSVGAFDRLLGALASS